MDSENTLLLNGVKVRTRQTAFGEYLKEWEMKYNPEGFNLLQYQDIRLNAGAVRFSMSAQRWVSETNARGIISEAGHYGGTYAHNAIALEFCAAISPAFKLGVYVDYLEMKEQTAQRLLKSYQFFLAKIEDNTLEANQMARDLLTAARRVGTPEDGH